MELISGGEDAVSLLDPWYGVPQRSGITLFLFSTSDF